MIRQLLNDIKDHLGKYDQSEEIKALIRRIDSEQNYFIITRLHRDDILATGVDASKMDDDDMVRLASKMSDDYCEQLFHEQIPILCEAMGFGRFECPNCPGEASQSDSYGYCYCPKCHYEWNSNEIPECFEDTYVLVEHPEDASHFENNNIGYPSFGSGDNGARYVSIENYFEHFKTLPAKNSLYSVVIWPDSQQYLELPDNLRELCENIESGQAFEDFGPSALWVPVCLINNEQGQL